MSEQFIHVEVKNSWSGLQGAGVGGPSTPPGRRILPPQIPTGLVGLTLLYKDTQRRDETVVSDYQSTNTDIFKSQWEVGAVKTAQRPRGYKSQLFRQDCDADPRGPSISFTLQRAAGRENIHRDVVKETLQQNTTHDYSFFFKTNESLHLFLSGCITSCITNSGGYEWLMFRYTEEEVRRGGRGNRRRCRRRKCDKGSWSWKMMQKKMEEEEKERRWGNGGRTRVETREWTMSWKCSDQ